MFRCWFCLQEKPESEKVHARVDHNLNRDFCAACIARLVICYDCGEQLTPDFISDQDNRAYCSRHYPNHFASCDNCGDTHPTSELTEIRHCLICYSCEESYQNCEECGSYTNTNDDGYCENCQCRPTIIAPTTFIRNKSERNIGIEIEFFSRHRPNIIGLGILKDDGSIRADEGEPLEFASWVAKGDAFLDLVDNVCNKLKAVDAKVNKSCGLHVHLEVSNETDDTRSNIRNWWQIFESIFFAIVSPSRRNNSFTRKTVGVPDRTWSSDRYHALNVMAYRRHGTYEIRLHQGSVNPEKIKNWTIILLNFFDTFSTVPATPNRLKRVKSFNDRDRMMYFYNSLSLPLTLRKYALKRIKEFDREAPPILNLSKNPMPTGRIESEVPRLEEVTNISFFNIEPVRVSQPFFLYARDNTIGAPNTCAQSPAS